MGWASFAFWVGCAVPSDREDEPVVSSTPPTPTTVPSTSSHSTTTTPTTPPDDTGTDTGHDVVPEHDAPDGVVGITVDVVINEVVSSNLEGLVDESGATPDWIELRNRSGFEVDLGGFGLSDDEDDPYRLTLPSVVLPPGGLLTVFASGTEDLSNYVMDTVVDVGATYAYRTGAEGVPGSWPDVGIDESSWSTGPSGFGYGDGDDATVVVADQVFTRTHFTLDAATIADTEAVWLHIDYDDGFVAYLNGVEVARSLVGVVGDVPGPADYALDWHEAVLYTGGQPEAYWIESGADLLVEGDNLLAVSVHNKDASSTDLSLLPILSLERATSGAGTPSAVLATDAIHAGFSVDALGETIVLTDPSGVTLDTLETGRLYADMSVGRDPTTGDRLLYMEPTPGAPNDTEGRPGLADTPTIGPESGFIGSDVNVTVEGQEGAALFYTTDGATPTPSATLYAEPFTLSPTGEARVVRASAVVDGLWPSRPATSTYLDVRPRLAVWSLTTDEALLFDPGEGIYHNNNIWTGWERPVHVEFFEDDGTLAFATDAGVKIHGGGSRTWDQKSLRLLFRSGYGDGRVEYPVFGPDEMDSFARLILRNAGHDWCYTMVRDGLTHALVGAADVDHQAYRPTVVYINGAYWGIHNVREKLDKYYVESHHGEDKDNLDILEYDGYTVGEGDNTAYFEMLDYAVAQDMSDPVHYAWVAARMDIDEYVQYVVIESFVNNYDWPGNNVKWWRPRRKGGKFRWMLYDTEAGLGNWSIDASYDMVWHMLNPHGDWWTNPAWSNELFRGLMDSDEFRAQYVNTYADALNTRFVEDEVFAWFDAYLEAIEEEIGIHQDRWGWSMSTHYYEIGVVTTFIEDRRWWVRHHLETNLGIGPQYTLSLDVDPPGAGHVALESIVVDEAFEGVYFGGVAVPLEAVAAKGWRFEGWSDPSLGSDPSVSYVPSSPSATLVATFVSVKGP